MLSKRFQGGVITHSGNIEDRRHCIAFVTSNTNKENPTEAETLCVKYEATEVQNQKKRTCRGSGIYPD